MQFETSDYLNSDTKLVRFSDKDKDGRCGSARTVRFKYDLSRGQIKAIVKAAEEMEYNPEYETFDIWILTVINEAMKKRAWAYDRNNRWKFDDVEPCLRIEV